MLLSMFPLSRKTRCIGLLLGLVVISGNSHATSVQRDGKNTATYIMLESMFAGLSAMSSYHPEKHAKTSGAVLASSGHL